MAKEEIYDYVAREGYDNIAGQDQELYDLYRQLDGYESHSCFSGVDFPGMALIFILGCVCGKVMKR